MGVIDFEELPEQVFFHDFILFISGVDVSDYVMGNLSWTISGRDGFNTCSFQLSNAEDVFVLSRENIHENKFRTASTDPRYSERAKFEIFNYKDDPDRNPADPFTKTRRWPLRVNELIFHKHDQVRLFVHNPITEEDSWIPAFAGIIETHSFNDDYVTGLRTIQIQCYDMRSLMQKMRTQLNSVVLLEDQTSRDLVLQGMETGELGIFSDLILDESQTHPFENKTLEQAVELLILGDLSPLAESIATITLFNGEQTRDPGKIKGIGNFRPGLRLEFDGEGTGTTFGSPRLTEWYNLCLFGTHLALQEAEIADSNAEIIAAKADLKTARDERIANATTLSDRRRGDLSQAERDARERINESLRTRSEAVRTSSEQNKLSGEFRPYREDEVRFIGERTTWEGEYGIHAMRLHFLVPKNGTQISTLIQSSIDTGSDTRNWSSRYEIINEFANRLDYQWWVTPIGDIVFEFPMYDFLPIDFGEYNSVLSIDSHMVTTNFSMEANEIVTAMRVVGETSTFEPVAIGQEIVKPQVALYAPVMAMRYGVNVEQVSIPFADNNIRTKLLGLIEFQKRLMLAATGSISFTYRPFILPNRPVYAVERDKIALSTAITNNMELFGECGTDVALTYVRTATDAKEVGLTVGALARSEEMQALNPDVYSKAIEVASGAIKERIEGTAKNSEFDFNQGRAQRAVELAVQEAIIRNFKNNKDLERAVGPPARTGEDLDERRFLPSELFMKQEAEKALQAFVAREEAARAQQSNSPNRTSTLFELQNRKFVHITGASTLPISARTIAEDVFRDGTGIIVIPRTSGTDGLNTVIVNAKGIAGTDSTAGGAPGSLETAALQATDDCVSGSSTSLDTLDTGFKRAVDNLTAKIKSDLGLEIIINSTFRSAAAQACLTRRLPKFAARGISPHQQGIAIDFSASRAGGEAISSADPVFDKIGDIAVDEIGMRWGGNFKSVKERWHFDDKGTTRSRSGDLGVGDNTTTLEYKLKNEIKSFGAQAKTQVGSAGPTTTQVSVIAGNMILEADAKQVPLSLLAAIFAAESFFAPNLARTQQQFYDTFIENREPFSNHKDHLDASKWGTFGVSQLLATTAIDLGKIDLLSFESSDLLGIPTNIALGATHLRNLYTAFQGSVPDIAAAWRDGLGVTAATVTGDTQDFVNNVVSFYQDFELVLADESRGGP